MLAISTNIGEGKGVGRSGDGPHIQQKSLLKYTSTSTYVQKYVSRYIDIGFQIMSLMIRNVYSPRSGIYQQVPFWVSLRHNPVDNIGSEPLKPFLGNYIDMPASTSRLDCPSLCKTHLTANSVKPFSQQTTQPCVICRSTCVRSLLGALPGEKSGIPGLRSSRPQPSQPMYLARICP
jgi:hypothetical protein